MNKFFRKAIVLALAGSALLYVGCTKDYSGEITTLQKELEDLKKSTSEQFTSLNNQIGNMQQQLSSLETAKERIEKNIQTLTDRVGALETFRSNAEQKFSQYEQKFTELDGEIAGLKANIKALQDADEAILKAIDAVKARIKALEDNTYNKTEVDNKLEALKNWAAESFATKEALSQVESALGILAGTVEGIDTRLAAVETTLSGIVDTEIPAIKQSIENLRTELAGVKQTAETAAANASQALGEIADLREQLKNYYTIAEVDALLKTMKNAIDEEIDALKKADVKLNERIDSLAGVTKKIEDDFAAFVTATNEKLADLEAKLDNEIALRLADSAANVAAHKKLNEYIKAVEDAYKLADDALNARCDALNDRCARIEGRVETLEGKVATLREEMDQAKLDIIANATEIANVKTDIAKKYAEIKARFEEDEKAIVELAANVILLWLNVDQLNSAAGRVQSVVFVPEYKDLQATLKRITLGEAEQGKNVIKGIVTATFELQPAGDRAKAYLDSLLKENELGKPGIGLAIKELKSRAVDADEVIYDVRVTPIYDNDVDDNDVDDNDIAAGPMSPSRCRFTIEAFLDPAQCDEDLAISCVLGDYKVGNLYSGNGLQSTYVGTYAKEIDLLDSYTWFDEKGKEQMEDSLGVYVEIPYLEPATDSLVFNGLGLPDNKKVAAFRMNIEGEYMTIEDVAKWLFITDLSMLTPVGEEVYWITKNANDQQVEENDPFELEDFAPETKLTTTTNDDGIVDPQYIHFTTGRKEIFKVSGNLIDPYAFVSAKITKEVVKFTQKEIEIPWSYVHPELANNKLIKPATLDLRFQNALTGTYSNEHESFTKDGESYPRNPQEETIDFIEAPVTFNGWKFDAADAKYVAKDEYFETNDKEYTIQVPFTLKRRPEDRDVEINLGLFDEYKISFAYTNPMNAIKPAFKGQEEYFMGDVEEYVAFINTDEELLAQEKTDSLYNAYDKADEFKVDSVVVTVNGDKKVYNYVNNNQSCPVHVDIDYDPETHEDLSSISIDPGFLPYGADVTVYGPYKAFEVGFYYAISFKTLPTPFKLILTPYGSYNPEVDKTVWVEGDDTKYPDEVLNYVINQMYFSKYLQVVDVNDATKPTTNGSNLIVGIEINYEELTEFFTAEEIEEKGQEQAEFERGTVNYPREINVNTGYYGDGSIPAAGLLDENAFMGWDSYTGRHLFVTANLYEVVKDGGDIVARIPVSEPLDFDIQTYMPIELKHQTYKIVVDPTKPAVEKDLASLINTDADGNELVRISGEPVTVPLFGKLIIGGILSRDEANNPYFVADPEVYRYRANNVAWNDGVDPITGENYIAGDLHQFYQLSLTYDWANVSATVNDIPWKLQYGTDFTTSAATQSGVEDTFTLLADSAKGTIIFYIPVKVRYMLDYCGKKAETQNIGVVIKQL